MRAAEPSRIRRLSHTKKRTLRLHEIFELLGKHVNVNATFTLSFTLLPVSSTAAITTIPPPPSLEPSGVYGMEAGGLLKTKVPVHIERRGSRKKKGAGGGGDVDDAESLSFSALLSSPLLSPSLSPPSLSRESTNRRANIDGAGYCSQCLFVYFNARDRRELRGRFVYSGRRDAGRHTATHAMHTRGLFISTPICISSLARFLEDA